MSSGTASSVSILSQWAEDMEEPARPVRALESVLVPPATQALFGCVATQALCGSVSGLSQWAEDMRGQQDLLEHWNQSLCLLQHKHCLDVWQRKHCVEASRASASGQKTVESVLVSSGDTSIVWKCFDPEPVGRRRGGASKTC